MNETNIVVERVTVTVDLTMNLVDLPGLGVEDQQTHLLLEDRIIQGLNIDSVEVVELTIS